MYSFQDGQKDQQHAGSKLPQKTIGHDLQNTDTCANDPLRGQAVINASTDSSGGERTRTRHQVKELKKMVPSAFKDKENEELSDNDSQFSYDESHTSDKQVQDCAGMEETKQTGSEIFQEQKSVHSDILSQNSKLEQAEGPKTDLSLEKKECATLEIARQKFIAQNDALQKNLDLKNQRLKELEDQLREKTQREIIQQNKENQMQAFINSQKYELDVATETIKALGGDKRGGLKTVIETSHKPDKSPRELQESSRVRDTYIQELQQRVDEANKTIEAHSLKALVMQRNLDEAQLIMEDFCKHIWKQDRLIQRFGELFRGKESNPDRKTGFFGDSQENTEFQSFGSETMVENKNLLYESTRGHQSKADSQTRPVTNQLDALSLYNQYMEQSQQAGGDKLMQLVEFKNKLREQQMRKEEFSPRVRPVQEQQKQKSHQESHVLDQQVSHGTRHSEIVRPVFSFISEHDLFEEEKLESVRQRQKQTNSKLN